MMTAKLLPSITTISRHLTCGSYRYLQRPNTWRTMFKINPAPLIRPEKHQKIFGANMSSVTEPLEVCVKASLTTPNKLGDCPFSQRVLLTLEEKHLPYEMKMVDLNSKPEWFLKLNPDGKVPLIKLDEKWISDSDVITRALEEKFPEPPLATPPEKSSVGSKIFSTFIAFLRSKDTGGRMEEALMKELTAFNDYLEDNGPFINGNKISSADLSLGPNLYHLEIALEHFKKWSVPDSLPHLKSYMKNIFLKDSFVKTRADPKDVVEGWRQHLATLRN